MLVNTSETAAAAFAANQGTIKALVEQYAEYLKNNGPKTGADIAIALHTDGRNHTRLRDGWKKGLVRKTGVVKPSAATGEGGEEWEYVPEGPGRIVAQREYWVDYHNRLGIELLELPNRIATAAARVASLTESINGHIL